jgi:hypothetical protein
MCRGLQRKWTGLPDQPLDHRVGIPDDEQKSRFPEVLNQLVNQ